MDPGAIGSIGCGGHDPTVESDEEDLQRGRAEVQPEEQGLAALGAWAAGRAHAPPAWKTGRSLGYSCAYVLKAGSSAAAPAGSGAWIG